MVKQILLILLVNTLIFSSCKKDEDVPSFPAPEIAVAPDSKVYKPGETALISVDVEAPGKIKEVIIGSKTITTFDNEVSVKGVSAEYVIPENTAGGDHKVVVIAVDKQTPAKTDTAEVILKIDADPCLNFDESEVNTGEGKIAITDFTTDDSGLVKEIIINNPNDKGGAGEANPSGCGKVMMFDKTKADWGGWNGFKIILKNAFSAADFVAFGRSGATKVLKVDVYRGEKSGAGAFPAEGLPIFVNIGNNAKYGDHPVGRSQYLIGTLTKNNDWETVTFQFNPANSGDIDPNVADNETDMMEFLPSGGLPDDGGLYYFDNLRMETDPNAGPGEPVGNAPTVCDFDLDETAVANAGWTKIFEDDFTSDLSKWNIWTGGAFNNELQHYQESNLQVENGMLLISAKKETVTGATNPYDATDKTFNFTSGRIECKTNVSASQDNPKVRMVARIKWPKGTGLWPAFWSYGDPWPTQGEIDILEAKGHEPSKYHTNYFYGTQDGANLVQNASKTITADADLTTCYHLYELVWEKDKLTSYLDGKVVEVKTSGGYVDDLFGKTQRIVLNLAVGGDFLGNLDSSQIQEGTMYVDYVKVYTSN
ncbi:MAG TPA: glycoside hydrolase family 16 protein [Cytophagales bacterium]|nr:glycoside hydrolase family 16 protein [Cytophagales bacterium]